jgi:hypothetical protein
VFNVGYRADCVEKYKRSSLLEPFPFHRELLRRLQTLLNPMNFHRALCGFLTPPILRQKYDFFI